MENQKQQGNNPDVNRPQQDKNWNEQQDKNRNEQQRKEENPGQQQKRAPGQNESDQERERKRA